VVVAQTLPIRPAIQTIGLISDTHGLLRPEALAALRDSDLIIHAGDVGDSTILDELRRLAPLVAVRGNVDTADQRSPLSPSPRAGSTPCADLPETAIVEVGSDWIYVLHDIKALDLNPRAAGIAMVVSGHSHKPSRHENDGVLYVNPGSAGPRRFSLPVTLASVDCRHKPWRVNFVDLVAHPR
jgi:putative phosphoesterase